MVGADPPHIERWLDGLRRAAAATPGLRAFLLPRGLTEVDAGRLRAAQIANLVRYSTVVLAANALNALILVVALSLRPFSPTPYIWIGALFLYLARLAFRGRGRPRRAAPNAASPEVVYRAIVHAAVLGAFWGATPILFLDADRSDQMIVTSICVGMLCGGSFVLATLPAAVLAFSLPLAFGSFVALVRTAHDPIHILALFLLASYLTVLFRSALSHGVQFADRVVAQVRAETAAQHDGLTGLPNRPAFEAAIAKAFGRLERYGERFAVLYFDLDDFKRVNDRLGHHAGDQLLCQVAGRLSGGVRDRDMVARLGGDEFVLLARGVSDGLGAARRADQMAQCFEAPFTLDGTPVECRPSIGIALAPDDGADPTSLVRHADAALYKAKRDRNKSAHFYRMDESRAAHDRRELAHDLEGAVARGEFFLQYQPIRTLEGERVVACEALVRWRHPRRGLVAPTQFIAIAEHSGAIHEIGEWAMREACAEAAGWPEPICVAVNVSAEEICDRSIIRVVDAALRDSRLAPHRLRVEITESALIAQIQGTTETLTRLGENGVSIVLDDFGTGFSSFDHIRRLPVSALKIDRSFVADLPLDRKSAAIVHAVAHLARSLDIEAVAEGVETEAQLDFLRRAGCHSGQGHLFARPLSPDALRPLLRPSGGLTRHVA